MQFRDVMVHSKIPLILKLSDLEMAKLLMMVLFIITFLALTSALPKCQQRCVNVFGQTCRNLKDTTKCKFLCSYFYPGRLCDAGFYCENTYGPQINCKCTYECQNQKNAINT
ncbi:uncharacterized protein LOC132062685 [Lycium ferocissimum]|uniref:uncharacterized protein LOC132062685 n=1 Tax=Lycium ferocissimum TaxID=112874 RepID=UPI002814C779|nr:uncharacterized protein LOC132062685 [Lycium ferocissimum]